MLRRVGPYVSYLEMRGITKTYPGVIANDNVFLSVALGEIHALVGENGAGKTTLMRILYGMDRPDSGEILIEGSPRRIANPQDALRNGIGMVHQKFKLIPSMTVAENIALGAEPRRGLELDFRQAREITAQLSKDFQLPLDPDAIVGSLSMGEQQRVEILKLLYREAEILIFDEATAVLSPQETRALFNFLEKCASEGKSVIYITHKLDEVMMIADVVTVLRHGKVVGTTCVRDVTKEQLSLMMVGEMMTASPPHRSMNGYGKTLLEVEGLRVSDPNGIERVRDVSFSVRSGQILGLAGVEGNGQLELAEAIAGLRVPEAGRIVLNDMDITTESVRKRRHAGMAYIPHDRYNLGVSQVESISDNVIACNYGDSPISRMGVLNLKEVRSFAEECISVFDVRTSSLQAQAGSLSGGNLQKLIASRELIGNPDVLIAVHPTHGLDIKATAFIRRKLRELRSQGKAVLLVSPDLDEILEMADTVAVMYEGSIVFTAASCKTDRETLGLYMTGAKDLRHRGEGAEHES